ncbi:DUF2663 family protein [Virgibacillus oceani]|uniref:Uncharacterized protein n=1 Tax=Virgibacillus oceani TaxID=1479511 RepID=A0A917H7T0_9BACI|nr:DUF2663 family protein [Virgibacillus oceani]GGG70762.1 hypothetical protein GCM10011398_13640 [Virgibacillus oceani]
MPWKDIVTDDTGIMLKSLIEKKKKKEKMKGWHSFFVIATLILLGALTVRIFIFQQELLKENPFNILSENYLLLMAAVTCFLFQNYYYTKKKKEKDKYDRLRDEVIDHLNYTWYLNIQPEIKDQISSYMQDTHDINVTFKTK